MKFFHRMMSVFLLLGLITSTTITPAATKWRECGHAEALWKELPMQVWPVLDGHAEGLLITSDSTWGNALIWDKLLNFTPTPLPAAQNTYWFFTDAKSAQVVYFPSHGEGVNYLPHWEVPLKDNGKAVFDAAQFTPLTNNPWGLHANAHIVDVEVNGGAGAPPNIHFVITKARVLDGAKGYPQPTDALSIARKEWDNWRTSVNTDVHTALNDAGRLAPGKPFGEEIEASADCFLPTWMPKERIIRVTYYQRITRTSSKTERHMVYHPNPLGAPGVPPMMVPITYSRIYGVDCALTIDIDASLHIGNEVRYAPSPITPSYDEPAADTKTVPLAPITP